MRARDALRPFALLTLFAGCAAHDVPEAPSAPKHNAAPAPPDAPSAVVGPAGGDALPAEALAFDDEAGLAEYERLLADKETRLRAAGILLAQREEAKRDDRYAPPPPSPAPAQAESVGDRGKRAKKEKDTRLAGRNDKGAGLAGGTVAPTTTTKTPDPAPRPTKPVARPSPADEFDAAALDAEPGGRCQTICDLADSTCDLESKICDLATRHPNEPRYADLCRRADEDCRLAAEACQLCSP